MPLSRTELARYSRHLLLGEFGTAGQEKLQAARVLVVGAGGLGSPAALYLAAAGVGTLGLLDCDRIDLSNLQRQVLYDTAQLGQPKAATARDRLAALNPEIRVVAHDVELRAGNVMQILGEYDVVLDGSDRVATRYLVNDACVLLGRTLVSAAIHRFEGQATTCVPRVGPCYRCLFPEPAVGAAPSCAEAGVLGVLPGVLGTIQATEAIKVITGIGEPLIGRLLTYDALTMHFDEFRFGRDADCRVCGAYRDIHAPHDLEEACATAVARGAAVTPAELRRLLAHAGGNRSVVLVDVRTQRAGADLRAAGGPRFRHAPAGRYAGVGARRGHGADRRLRPPPRTSRARRAQARPIGNNLKEATGTSCESYCWERVTSARRSRGCCATRAITKSRSRTEARRRCATSHR
jgi:molybdopterin/thiamine biosynthesis adenylyltransferase